MKGLALLCMIFVLLIAAPAQSQTLYDDFTGPLLSSTKWFSNRLVNTNITNTLEFGQVISKKKLDMFNQCFGSTVDGDTGTRTCSTRLAMQDGSGIVAMEALVQPIALEQTSCEANVDNTTATWIRLGGAFFNSTPITGTVSDQTNDVQAYIALVRRGDSQDPPGVFSIEGSILRCTNGDCSTSVIVTTDPPTNPITLGTVSVKKKILLRLEWDSANHQFVFRQGKKASPVALTYSPRENHPPFAQNGGFKRLEVRHALANCTAGPTRGWARAYFDNFYVVND